MDAPDWERLLASERLIRDREALAWRERMVREDIDVNLREELGVALYEGPVIEEWLVVDQHIGRRPLLVGSVVEKAEPVVATTALEAENVRSWDESPYSRKTRLARQVFRPVRPNRLPRPVRRVARTRARRRAGARRAAAVTRGSPERPRPEPDHVARRGAA